MSFDNVREVNLLAFDTSTGIARAGVLRAGGAVIEEAAPGGAQSSQTLIPMVQSLLAGAGLALEQLDAIVFGRGPGSFTGLRTACSVAQGLAFGAKVPVLGVDTLLAVAEDARERTGAQRVVALLDARMNEVYAARYVHDTGAWRRDGEIALMSPADVAAPAGWVLAGNAFSVYSGALPRNVQCIEAAPTASALLRVAPQLIAAGHAHDASQALPLYIRDKVAQTTEERARAAQAPKASA